mgnify:CR=1 FL=1
MVRLRPNLVLTGVRGSTAHVFEGTTSCSPTALGRLSSAPGLPPAPVGTVRRGRIRPSAPCRHPGAASTCAAAPLLSSQLPQRNNSTRLEAIGSRHEGHWFFISIFFLSRHYFLLSVNFVSHSLLKYKCQVQSNYLLKLHMKNKLC